LLAGLLYDDAGNRMVPSHARKGEIVYRYYTSVLLMRGSKTKVGGVSRAGAPRIERVIVDALNGAKIASPGASVAKLLRLIDKIILHPVEIEIRLNKENDDCDLIRVAADLRSAKNGILIIEEHGAIREVSRWSMRSSTAASRPISACTRSMRPNSPETVSRSAVRSAFPL